MRLDFPGDAGQQIVEAGLRVDGRVDQHFAPQGDARGFFEEAEGRRGREREAVLPIGAALWEAHFDRLFERGAARDQREIHRFQSGAGGVSNAFHPDGKRGHEPLLVAHEELAGDRAPGGDVLGHQEVQLKRRQREAAHQSGDQQRGQHGGGDEEQQVVGGNDGAEADHQRGQDEQQAGAGDLVPDAAVQEKAEVVPELEHGSIRLYRRAYFSRFKSCLARESGSSFTAA